MLNRHAVWHGFRQLLPISLFVAVFGLAFGLAAVQTGLGGSAIVLMSTLVFAGAAQFATLDLWGTQVPLIPLAVTVFAINARHLLMGATLYPWLRHLPPAQRYAVMLVASDANWGWSPRTPTGRCPSRRWARIKRTGAWACCWAAGWRCGCSGFWAPGWACSWAAPLPTRYAGGWTW